MNPAPIILKGANARLELLDPKHAAGLFAVGQDERIWRYLLRPKLESVADALSFVEDALRMAATARSCRLRSLTKRITRLLVQRDIWTAGRTILRLRFVWLGRDFQRTAINTECKYLLLRHAFEDLGAIRVTLKTDGRNEQSQRAIERLGAGWVHSRLRCITASSIQRGQGSSSVWKGS